MISIVFPAYNEEGNVAELHRRIMAAMQEVKEPFEIIAVDNASTDGTSRELLTLKPLKVIRFAYNIGQTAALDAAIRVAKYPIVVTLDADLQNDPADIPTFLAKIDEGFSCVSGWRKNRKDAFFSRKLPSWTANTIISLMTRLPLHDYGCTMKAYTRDVIQGIELYGEMHRFIPAYAAWTGAKVSEIVVNHRERKYGESKYGLSRVFKVVLDLIVVRFLTTSFNTPMHFFGAAGIASLGIGFLAEVAAVYLKLAGLRSLVETPLPVVGAMFVIVGVQFILFGLLAEVLMRTYYESRHAEPYRIRETLNT